MVNLKRSKSNFSPAQFADGLPSAFGQFPRALDHGVHEAASRVAEAAEAAQTLAGKKLDQIPSFQMPSRPELPSLQVPSFQMPSRPQVPSLQIPSRGRIRWLERKQLRPRSALSTATVKDDRRKARLARRRRLTGNLALGAAVMYHLDPDQGRERRRATSRRLKRLISALKRSVSWLKGLTSRGD